MSPPDLHAETLPASVTVSGDGTFQAVVRTNKVTKVEPWRTGMAPLQEFRLRSPPSTTEDAT